MISSALSPRVIFPLLLILLLSACGGAPAAATELYPDAPAATEPPVEEPIAVSTENSPGAALPTATLAGIHESIPTSQPPPISIVQPAIPERRRITLEFPPRIRAGDSDVIRLTLEVDDLGNLTPTAEFEGNVVTGEVIEIPNLYETHQVIAEARFDIAGLRVSPPNLVSQPLAQGQSITFHWSILPEGVGIYRGTIWLYLRFVDKVSGEESQKTVSAQIVEIEAVNFLGLSGSLARTFGVVGSIVGTVLGIPFLEDAVRFVFGRRRKK